MLSERLHAYSPQLHYGAVPKFFPASELTDGGFASLYSVSPEDAKAIEQEGTVARYCGVVWSERLWLDADSDEAAASVKEKLDEMGLDYIAYHTGNRGGHFGILRPIEPSHLLPQRDKAWASAHFGGLVDLSLYTHLHLFRLPGTRHAKTGLPKELVLDVRGKALQLPKLEKNNDRVSLRSVRPVSGGYSVFDCSRVMGNSVPIGVGDRHAALVRLAYALRDEAQVPFDYALWWMLEVNKMFEEPKNEKEVEAVAQKVYKS